MFKNLSKLLFEENLFIDNYLLNTCRIMWQLCLMRLMETTSLSRSCRTGLIRTSSLSIMSSLNIRLKLLAINMVAV